jgi:hypothetical protein
MKNAKTILFVYNTHNGALQSFKDYFAGTASASGTGICPLSAITHSPVGMKKEWKRFLKDLEIPSRLLDRNEFSWEFGCLQTPYPAVVVQDGTELTVLVGPEELKQCRDLNDLIQLLQQRLPQVPAVQPYKPTKKGAPSNE